MFKLLRSERIIMVVVADCMIPVKFTILLTTYLYYGQPVTSR